MAPRTRNMTKPERVALFNSRGFSALPIELYCRILSYMQGTDIPCDLALMDSQCRERRHVLRVLCQLSRSLRAALLPLLWERLEACARKPRSLTYPGRRPRRSVGTPKLVPRGPLLADELLGQLKLINIRKLPYASYVRIVNVAIEAGREDETLGGLARSLTLMPNLHTIQIICERSDPPSKTRTPTVDGDKFRKAFTGRLYPSVRRAVLPIEASDIFRCLPEVREVYLNQRWTVRAPGFVENLSRYCPKVENFGWADNYGLAIYAVVRYLPNVRRLTFSSARATTDDIIQLSKLKSLEKMTVNIKPNNDLDDGSQIKEAIQAMLLARSPPRRHVDLVFLDGDQTGIFPN